MQLFVVLIIFADETNEQMYYVDGGPNVHWLEVDQNACEKLQSVTVVN